METVTIRTTTSKFNLDTFDSVKLVKVGTFEPVETLEAAQARVGGDLAKLISLLNDGLKSHAQETLRTSAEPWHTYKKDETGEDTEEINGVFEGTLADEKAVDTLVLGMAKSVYGYKKDMTPEQKRASKEKAMELIKNTEPIREGLKESAKAA